MFTAQFISPCPPCLLIIEFLKLCSLLAATMRGREKFSPLPIITEGELNPPQKFSHRLQGPINTQWLNIDINAFESQKAYSRKLLDQYGRFTDVQ